jgi:hypothetical protein
MNFHRFHPNPEIQRKLDYAHQIRADFLRECFRSFGLRVARWFRDLAGIDRMPRGTNSYQTNSYQKPQP